MLSILRYRNGRPDHQATAPVYLAAMQQYDWEAVHRQVLTELEAWLLRNGQGLSPKQTAERAYQWQRALLSAVQDTWSADAWPTRSTVEAVFCQVFGVAGHALLARKHQEQIIQTIRHAETIVTRLQADRGPRP